MTVDRTLVEILFLACFFASFAPLREVGQADTSRKGAKDAKKI
jgi:hypothetical protein